MKRFCFTFGALVVLALFLSFGKTTAFASEDVKLSTYGYPVGNSYMSCLAYKTLTRNEQQLWNNLKAQAIEYLFTDLDYSYAKGDSEGLIMGNCRDNYGLTMEDMDKVYSLFKYSNPEFYYISKPCHDESCSFYFKAFKNFSDGVKRASFSQKFFDRLRVYAQVTDNSTINEPGETICYLVSANTTYDENSPYLSSAYGVICDGKGVCAGYSLAVSAVCNMLKIDSVLVCSDDHAWNYVKSDSDAWLQYDSTNETILQFRFNSSQYAPKKDYKKLLDTCDASVNSYSPIKSLLNHIGGLLSF